MTLALVTFRRDRVVLHFPEAYVVPWLLHRVFSLN
jgi:hypothetical protein